MKENEDMKENENVINEGLTNRGASDLFSELVKYASSELLSTKQNKIDEKKTSELLSTHDNFDEQNKIDEKKDKQNEIKHKIKLEMEDIYNKIYMKFQEETKIYKDKEQCVKQIIEAALDSFYDNSLKAVEEDEYLNKLKTIMIILEAFQYKGFEVNMEIFQKKFKKCLEDNINYKLKSNTHALDGARPAHVFVFDFANDVSDTYNTDRYVTVGRLVNNEICAEIDDKYRKFDSLKTANNWIKKLFSENVQNVNEFSIDNRNWNERFDMFIKNIINNPSKDKVKNIKIVLNCHGEEETVKYNNRKHHFFYQKTVDTYDDAEDEVFNASMIKSLFDKISEKLPGYNIEIVNQACYGADLMDEKNKDKVIPNNSKEYISLMEVIEDFSKRYTKKNQNCVITYARNFSPYTIHHLRANKYGTDKYMYTHTTPFEYQVFDTKQQKFRVACTIEDEKKYYKLKKNKKTLKEASEHKIVDEECKGIRKYTKIQKDVKNMLLYGPNKNIDEVIKSVEELSSIKNNTKHNLNEAKKKCLIF